MGEVGKISGFQTVPYGTLARHLRGPRGDPGGSKLPTFTSTQTIPLLPVLYVVVMGLSGGGREGEKKGI